jgi:acyl carrier protein
MPTEPPLPTDLPMPTNPARPDRNTLRQLALAALYAIAPEVAADSLDAARPLRSQVDLDSMDWLHFLVALNQRTGVPIPEADYARLVTLDNVLDYLLARLPP